MTSNPDGNARDVLRKAYLEIRELRSRLSERESSRNEAIAVVGIGCRFPGGVVDAESFWSVLRGGVDAVRETPLDRWDTAELFDADPDAPGKLYARHGSFLDSIDRFDAAFFGISPVEAAAMDPQQRLLLEVAWEALEHAAIPADALRGSSTGVFVGLMYQDYLARQTRDAGRDAIGPYLGTGSTFSAAAGRLSYVLGLQGPSIAVDTACSSSLVSVHLACQALRNGECGLALAGGANVMLTPEASINLSKARMLSPTGRCRTFDAAADGYVRGEGAGIVVLKRLSKARADGDRILGLVRGSAVNQDGRSNGLTAPNGSAQRALLQQALAAAGATPEDVEYVECHGTGTPLGDPIEVGALVDVYGKRSPETPLAIGSVKTNFGHLESAAGICGFIKALLVLAHREVPPHLHLQRLNPYIRVDERTVAIPTAPTPWFRRESAMAAVSAFGFVGTNAHVVLESADGRRQSADESTPPLPTADCRLPSSSGAHVLTISASSEAAFTALRDCYVEHLASSADDLADICFTANSGRSHLAFRTAVVATDRESMREKLAVAVPERIDVDAPRVAFLFTGQGSQSRGAGARLYEAEPHFRAVIDRCDSILRPHLGHPLGDLLFGDAFSLLEQTRYAQPAIVALEVALFELWSSWGVKPSILFGHSVGDFAAAIAGGTLPLEQALRIVAERGRLMQELPAGGGMAALVAPEAWGREAIAPYPKTLAIAAVNAPEEIVISGRLDDLQTVLERARAAGFHARQLAVSHAFHSPLMRPMLDPFRKVLSGVADAERWVNHVMAPVRFVDSVEALRTRGDEILLEIGPRPVLAPLAARQNADAIALASLQPGRDDVEQMLETLAALYAQGVRIDWPTFHAPSAARKVTLPTYPFQRERHWIGEVPSVSDELHSRPFSLAPAGEKVPKADEGAVHQALFGHRLPQAPHLPDTFVWQVDVDRVRHPQLYGHTLRGTPVWPIAAQMQLALDAAGEVLGGERLRVESLEFQQTLHADERQEVQAVLTKGSTSEAEFRLYSRNGDSSPWTLNTTARLKSGAAGGARPLELSMMFFAAKEDDDPSDRYRLIIEAARFADGNGFRSVWVPERHFTHMGSLYPNPTVLHAALARETSRVRLMAGSVVLPLHNVLRVAEEWAMVDNLSAGRVGVSLAPGWNPNDFVLAPEKYDDRYNDLYAGVEKLRSLWRGETFEADGPHGKRVRLRTYPTPVQPELPIWITAARSVESFRRAGALGANLLTHLLDQDVEALAGKIAVYRGARAENGFDPAGGNVTVMCHTFVAADVETAQQLAKKPFCEYLKSSMPLLAGLATSRGTEIDVNKLSSAELDEFVEFLYERFRTSRALIGTPESCRPLLDSLAAAGVNEVACLLDFGPTTDEVLQHLPMLASLCGGDGGGSARRTGYDQVRRRCPAAIPLHEFYSGLTAAGVGFDGALRAIDSLASGEREAVAEIRADDDVAAVDACVQTALAALPRTAGEPLRVPVRVGRIQRHATISGKAWAHGRVSKPASDGTIDGEVSLYDESGELLLEINGLRVKPVAAPAVVANPDWFYEIAWREAAWADASRTPSRPWVILEDSAGVARAWASRRRGAAHLFLQHGAVTEQVGPGQWTVGAASGFAQLLRNIDISAYEGILCCWPLDAAADDALDADALEREQSLGVEPVIALLQALGEGRNAPPLWVVTRGAVHSTPIRTSQSTLWGLAGAIAREMRPLWGGIIDLDPLAPVQRCAEELDRAVSCGGEEDQVAIRGGKRLVRRLVPAVWSAATAVAALPPRFRDDAAYLITGGTGGLGLAVARWMLDHGARHLILASRSGAGQAFQPVLLGMELEGQAGKPVLHVETVALDVSDEARVLEFAKQHPEIRGVVHAAGVFHDEPLRRLDRDALWDVLRAKVRGAWSLDRAFAGRDLDFFVLFSSFSALTPPAGQAAYAAASAFLDALAQSRRLRGERALSIGWGAWSDVGFAATDYGREAHARLEALGMRRLTPAEGLAVLGRLMSGDGVPAHVAVFPADLAKMASADPVLERRPLLRELIRERDVVIPHGAPPLLRVRTMDTKTQQQFLRERVGRAVAEILKIPQARLDLKTPLTQLGLDSLIAVQLKNRIEKETGMSVPLTSALRGASVNAMVEELIVELRLGEVRAGANDESTAREELEL